MDENRPDKQTDSGPLERHVELDSGIEYAAVPLPQGAQVDNFIIARTICDSFSGFTYAATDADNRRPFVIQEYFPEEVSVRDLDRVSLLLRDETVSNEFEFGLTRFYRLTGALSRYEGKGRVAGVFEQNDTAYYATPFDFRCTLNDVLASGKRVPAANVESWLKGCLRFLVAPHQANVLHLGIQADSVILDGEGDAILVGFNSVGPSFHVEPHKPEYLYLPIERIRSEAEMLPASDLYSLAAVLVHCMTGRPPSHAARRTGAVSTGRPDPLDAQLAEVEQHFTPAVIRTLRWMLAPQPKDRPQSAVEAMDAMDLAVDQPIPTVHKVTPKPAPTVVRSKSAKERHAEQAASPAPTAKKTPPDESTPKLKRRHGRDTRAGEPVLDRPAPADTPTARIEPPAQQETPQQQSSPGHAENDTGDSSLNWFGPDASEAPSKRSAVALVFAHPATWIAAVILALAAAWFWLGRESDVPNARERAPDVPRINVVPDTAPPAARPQPPAQAQPEPGGAATPAEPRQDTDEVRPTVVLESASRITADEDTAQFQQLRQFDALERQLEPLFMEVEAHLANDRLIAPQGSNALETYQEILEIEPGNTRALQGISTIEAHLVQAADAALAEGDPDAAEREISALAEFSPDNENVERVRDTIADIRLQRELEAEAARQQAEEEERQRQLAEQRQDQLQSLLAQAISRFDSGRLVEPPLDNALFFYREMLKIDPASQSANAGIAQIADHFVREARQNLASNELDVADRNLTTAAAIDPAHGEIPTVREQIDTRRRLVEQEQRALAEAERNRQEAQQAAMTQAEMSLQAGVSAYYRGNYDEAYSFLKPLAEGGNARAQFRLAVMLHNGRGVTTNRAEARKWFLAALEPIRIAANSGTAWAQADMGSYYEDGIIMDVNYREAATWYLRAAEQGYAGAQTNLGVMYANGQGVEPDMKRAIEWFKRAAVQGDSIAKENLRILGQDPNDVVLGSSG